jgi:hypothetical protein
LIEAAAAAAASGGGGGGSCPMFGTPLSNKPAADDRVFYNGMQEEAVRKQYEFFWCCPGGRAAGSVNVDWF